MDERLRLPPSSGDQFSVPPFFTAEGNVTDYKKSAEYATSYQATLAFTALDFFNYDAGYDVF